jgi:hypothetical protein
MGCTQRWYNPNVQAKPERAWISVAQMVLVYLLRTRMFIASCTLLEGQQLINQ